MPKTESVNKMEWESGQGRIWVLKLRKTLVRADTYSHQSSTSTIGSKRKSPSGLRPHKYDNKPYETNAAVSAKPPKPKRLLSGEDASKAKEMAQRKGGCCKRKRRVFGGNLPSELDHCLRRLFPVPVPVL